MSPTISVSPQGAIDAGCAASVVYPAWQHTANRSGDTSAGLGASAWAKGYSVSVTEKGGWRLQSVEITSRFTATSRSGAQETSTATETFSDEYDDPLPNPWTRADPWKNTPQRDLDRYVEWLGGRDSATVALEEMGIESEYVYSGPAASPYNYVHTSREVVSIVAHFQYYQPQTRTITAVADPTQGGTVSGGGRYLDGTTVTLDATANAGWQFDSWTSPGEEPVTTSSMSFVVSKNVTWTAHFTEAPKSRVKLIVKHPEGTQDPLHGGGGWSTDQGATYHTVTEMTVELPIGKPASIWFTQFGYNHELHGNVAFLDRESEEYRKIIPCERLYNHPYSYRFTVTPTAVAHVFELWFTVHVSLKLGSNIGLFFTVDDIPETPDDYKVKYNIYEEDTSTLSSVYYPIWVYNTVWNPYPPYDFFNWTSMEAYEDDVPVPPYAVDTVGVGPSYIANPTRTGEESGRVKISARERGYNFDRSRPPPYKYSNHIYDIDKSGWVFSHWEIKIPNLDGTTRTERVNNRHLDWTVPMFGLEFTEPVVVEAEAVYEYIGKRLNVKLHYPSGAPSPFQRKMGYDSLNVGFSINRGTRGVQYYGRGTTYNETIRDLEVVDETTPVIVECYVSTLNGRNGYGDNNTIFNVAILDWEGSNPRKIVGVLSRSFNLFQEDVYRFSVDPGLIPTKGSATLDIIFSSPFSVEISSDIDMYGIASINGPEPSPLEQLEVAAKMYSNWNGVPPYSPPDSGTTYEPVNILMPEYRPEGYDKYPIVYGRDQSVHDHPDLCGPSYGCSSDKGLDVCAYFKLDNLAVSVGRPPYDKYTFVHWLVTFPDGSTKKITSNTLEFEVPFYGIGPAEPPVCRARAVFKCTGSILYTPTSGRILHGRSGTILYLE